MNLLAGIVLCGGRSRRMGRSKADLEFGGQTLLQRTVETIQQVADPVVVAAGPSQDLPQLPASVTIVRDPTSDEGPLAAFVSALAAIPPECEWVFVAACDLPFLSAEVIRLIFALRSAEVTIPDIRGSLHPLTALYRRSVTAVAEKLLIAGRRRMLDLIDVV